MCKPGHKKIDSDNDGVCDAFEVELGTNPRAPDRSSNKLFVALHNLGRILQHDVVYINILVFYRCSDGDGYLDGEELKLYQGFPLDSDGDGQPDALDTDSDNGTRVRDLGVCLVLLLSELCLLNRLERSNME